jgi:Cytochrome C oxidase, cbb3-type, subunit III
MWYERIVWAVLLAGCMGILPAHAEESRYGLGRTPTAAEITAWNTDVRADGQGLPLGQGSVAQGRAIFAANCAACHGEKGEGGLGEPLAGGFGTLTKQPVARCALGALRLDPLVVLTTIACVTKHIGLACTISTTYFEPFAPPPKWLTG